MARELVLTDPTYDPKSSHNALDRFFLKYIKDPRDLPFAYLSLQATFILIPFAAYLFIPGNVTWWLALIYLTVNFLVFVDRFILMLHNTSHRSLFKKKYRVFNHYIPWVLGPFMGETPETYYAHHIGMHHPENNLEDDLSSTMRYQRDSVTGFLRYFLRFFVGGIIEMSFYHSRRGRKKLLRRMIVGELSFYIAVAIGLVLHWQATLVVFVIPFCFVRFMMMAGNWGQHAFIDANDPGNCHRNSITCINTRYNRRCYNDGYHISHHLKANRHWTDHPGELLDNIDVYAREEAIVFEGIDFFMVWVYLMLKRYDWLANAYVQLGDEELSKDEIIALLKERTRAIPAPSERGSSEPAIA